MSTQDPNDPGPASSGNPDDDDKPTVLSIIRGLQNGTVSPKSLSIYDRGACVEHLTGEGYSIVEIAEILRVSGRTIARDRKAIQEANAIERDPELADQLVGRLGREADLAISHIRRVAREKKTPASVKVDAEHRCYQVFSDYVQRLQRLGYLPTAAHEIRADLTHHVDEPPSFEQMLTEIGQFELVVKEDGGNIQRRLGELKKTLTQHAAHEQIEQISEAVQHKEDPDVENA